MADFLIGAHAQTLARRRTSHLGHLQDEHAAVEKGPLRGGHRVGAEPLCGPGIPASILVLNREKPTEQKGKVLFIDVSAEFGEGTNQNRLRHQDIEHISRTFHAYADVEKYARVVLVKEIEQNDWNLNISRYVETPDEEERIDVGEAGRGLRELERKRSEAEGTMNRYLAELGYGT